MPNSTPRARLAVGLISGTSMDGVDAALVKITGAPDHCRLRLVAFLTLPYPAAARTRVHRLATGKPVSLREVSQLNFLLGETFADAALRVCRKAGVSTSRLAVIGSHGQTIYHQGKASLESGRRVRSTLQIAEPAVIAEKTRVPVVADFRKADMTAGGQGAPLVPLLDYLLLRSSSFGTVALNIGGIANVTVIPAGARPTDVTGFDTGPGNMVMDALVRHFTRGHKSYDAGGKIAATGRVVDSLLEETLRLPYFCRRPPKSAGREQFGSEFMARFFLKRTRRAGFRDLLRTANELTVRSVTEALETFVFPRVTIDRLIVSGGGVHNRFLITRLAQMLPHLALHTSDDFGLPVDAKEAIAFAVLADHTLHGLHGNIPSVTGAHRTVVLGAVVGNRFDDQHRKWRK